MDDAHVGPLANTATPTSLQRAGVHSPQEHHLKHSPAPTLGHNLSYLHCQYEGNPPLRGDSTDAAACSFFVSDHTVPHVNTNHHFDGVGRTAAQTRYSIEDTDQATRRIKMKTDNVGHVVVYPVV